MTIEKQDSNNAGLFVAREASNRVLGGTPAFVTREPNSFADLGGEYTLLARRPFSPSRQRRKGGIVDLNAGGGWNEDVTMGNMGETAEAVMFAAKHRKGYSDSAAAVAATNDFTVASTAGMLVNSLLFAKGFTSGANNGLHVCNGVTDGTHVSTSSALADEGGAVGKIVRVVGYQFPAGDIVASLVGAFFRLTSTAIDLTTLGLAPGEWVFIGGDLAGNQLDPALTGYARIAAITAGHIDFDKTTFTAAADDGAGTTLRVFFGTVVKNEVDPNLIVKYTHTIERTLGSDADGRQSEYIDGFVFDEMKFTSPLSDKVHVDLKGVGATYHTRTGAQGPLNVQAGATITPALGEDPINTASNVYRLRMAKVDPTTLNPTALFARVSEWSGTFKNNVSPAKAQGTLGAFDTTAGVFEVDMEVTAYFATVAPMVSLSGNDDVTFDAIYAAKNRAMIVDFPLIALGGGKLTVDMDKPIMVPLKNSAAQSVFGHTALFNFFPYVPSVGNA